MGLHRIKRGLRLPILGEPSQEIEAAESPRRVALLGADYVGMRPTMKVSVGIPGTSPNRHRTIAVTRMARGWRVS